MMRFSLALTFAMTLGGCMAGDSTGGAENRSAWRIDDGLCPGAEGGCAMTVPVAARVELSVDSNIYCARPQRDSSGRLVSDCDLSAFGVTASGAAEMRSASADASAGRLDLRVFTTEEGQARLELAQSGSYFDSVGMEVREAVDIRCGAVGGGGASWDMDSLDTSGSYTVNLSGADRETKIELGCTLLDARGLPLFSAAAINWQIIEGADIAIIDDGGLFGGDASTGARVYVRPSDSGLIRVRAVFEDLTRELMIDAG